MTHEEVVCVFRIVSKFNNINENTHKSIIDLFIENVRASQGAARLGVVYAFHSYLSEKMSSDVANAVLFKLYEHGKLPHYDLSTYEGFLRAFAEEMASGASFGGALSGAGDNATINATGLAGVDKPLNKKPIKRKIDKIIS